MNRRYSRRILPGFGLTIGFTVFYLSAVVLIPLSALVLRAADLGVMRFFETVTAPRVAAAYRLTLGLSALSAMINAGFGLTVAWVLTRYRFPGRRILDAMVDLPFALPTAVSGIALAAVYSRNGWIGGILYRFGIESAYSRLGITIALTFIGLPFVVRTLQPVIEDLDAEVEEAAACLGADWFQTLRRVILPTISPALLTGFVLAFARAIGEYGSVVFISGNMPMRTEIVPLLIVAKLEQYDYAGAAAIGASMLIISFFILLSVQLLSWWTNRRTAGPSV